MKTLKFLLPLCIVAMCMASCSDKDEIEPEPEVNPDNPDEGDTSSATISLIASTSSSLTYSWGFTDEDGDAIDGECEVCLYSDEACDASSLVVGWTVSDNGLFSSEAGNRFTFSGLDASKTYYCKVTAGDELATRALRGTTASAVASVTATAEGSAVAGDVIVGEGFTELYHGGDVAHLAAGYSVAEGSRTENVKASGMDAAGCVLAAWDEGFDVFDGAGVSASYTEGAGLSGWTHEGNAIGHTGYLEVGASGAAGAVLTPELAALPDGECNVRVSVSAKVYSGKLDGSSADTGTLTVSAVEGGSTLDEAQIDISTATTAFYSFDAVLLEVTNGSRISVGTASGRALLNSVVVTYLGPTNTSPLGVPQNVAFDTEATTESSLTLTWDAVENAYYYTVKYWKEGDEGNAMEVSGIEGTGCTIDGLDPDTTYYVQVKACDYNSDYDSEYGETVSATTLVKQGITISLVEALSSSICIEWNMNGCTKEETIYYKYDVGLYTTSDCVDETLFVSWLFDDTTIWSDTSGVLDVRFTFSGLSEDTPYWVKISVIDDPDICSDPFAVRTAAFKSVVTASEPGSAGVGDVILAENFGGLVCGSDNAHHSIGVTSNGSKSRSEMHLPRGKNPTTYLKLINWDTEFNIYYGSGVTAAYTEATGFADWAIGYDTGGTTGSTNTSTRPGYAKVGGGSAYGYFATPELSAIPEGKTATVRVDFSCKDYTGVSSAVFHSNCNSVMVAVVDNIEMVNEYCVSGWGLTEDEAELTDSEVVELIKDGDSIIDRHFEDHSVTLRGVTNTSRIRFSSNTTEPASSNMTRFHLSGAVVTVIDME